MIHLGKDLCIRTYWNNVIMVEQYENWIYRNYKVAIVLILIA